MVFNDLIKKDLIHEMKLIRNFAMTAFVYSPQNIVDFNFEILNRLLLFLAYKMIKRDTILQDLIFRKIDPSSFVLSLNTKVILFASIS